MTAQLLVQRVRVAAVCGAVAIVGTGAIAGGQRLPCANFDGPGRIPYCGGKPGVYAIVETVTLEPGAAAPERIRITGTFVVPVPISSGLHQPPQRGYLYFSLPSERQEAIRKDWADLAKAAGTGRVVGFAEYWVSRPFAPGDPVYEAGNRRGTMNTPVEVRVHKVGGFFAPEPYPLPHESGVLTSFGLADETPRFGRPSSAIVAELLEAAKKSSIDP